MPPVEPSKQITCVEELRTLYKEPSLLVREKILSELDAHCEAMIRLSPFVCVSTRARDGSLDVSPRGDPPGFVKVLTRSTLLIPDRTGNTRIDTLTNLTGDPEIALLFFVPGVVESLRVSGRASLIRDDPRLVECAVDGKVPLTGIVVEVRRVFLQCGKAIKRSGLWEGTYAVERSELASFGQMLVDQTKTEMSADQLDAAIQEAYVKKLY